MQNRLKIALVVAVFFGLIAAYGIYNFLSHQQKEAESLRAANQDIVVAAQDIPPGTTFNEETMKKGLTKTTFITTTNRRQGESGKDPRE